MAMTSLFANSEYARNPCSLQAAIIAVLEDIVCAERTEF